MNIGIDVVWAVELDDPVDGGKVEASRRDIRTDQQSRVGRRKLLENAHSCGLLLLAVEMHERQTGVEAAECLENEADLFARRDEHDAFHLQVALDETPQSVELALQRHDCVELLQVGRHDTLFSCLVAVEVHRVM